MRDDVVSELRGPTLALQGPGQVTGADANERLSTVLALVERAVGRVSDEPPRRVGVAPDLRLPLPATWASFLPLLLKAIHSNSLARTDLIKRQTESHRYLRLRRGYGVPQRPADPLPATHRRPQLRLWTSR